MNVYFYANLDLNNIKPYSTPIGANYFKDMNRLKRLFKEKNKNVLNLYFTAGYPKLNDTEEIVLALEKAGVDMIEIGIPYSDPLADGPTIQASGMQALENGMTLPLLFDQIKTLRQKTDIPLILMGNFNQIMQFGEEKFIAACVEAQVDGVILPDLPVFEYETYYKDLFEKAGIYMSFLISPQTSPERIHKIDELTHSFIYMVSSAAITGAKSGISDGQLAYFNRINDMKLKNPRLIGFGISNHETYSTACQYANGAIIGSAFIRVLKDADNIPLAVEKFVQMVRGND